MTPFSLAADDANAIHQPSLPATRSAPAPNPFPRPEEARGPADMAQFRPVRRGAVLAGLVPAFSRPPFQFRPERIGDCRAGGPPEGVLGEPVGLLAATQIVPERRGEPFCRPPAETFPRSCASDPGCPVSGPSIGAGGQQTRASGGGSSRRPRGGVGNRCKLAGPASDRRNSANGPSGMASLAAWAGAFTAKRTPAPGDETVASRVLVSAAPCNTSAPFRTSASPCVARSEKAAVAQW